MAVAIGHDLDMRSRVHPNFKTEYRISNWASYDRALIRRGDVTVWLSADAIATWTTAGVDASRRQCRYSDHAIETAITLRLIFHLPLRQTEGFLRSIFSMMHVALPVPDHTTLSRRGQRLQVALQRVPRQGPIQIFVDSTGLTMMGEGEWTIAKHGGQGKRRWRKLHLGVDEGGAVVAQAVTSDAVRDATTGVALIQDVHEDVIRVTADAGYDTRAFYEAATRRGADVVVPPKKTATSGHGQSPARDRAIDAIKRVGRRQWKKDSGYHRQARVENAFYRYKSTFGGALRARSERGQMAETVIACNVLNQMTELGKPESCATTS